MPNLLDDEEETDFEIKVNDSFAEKYADRKRKEELSNLKQRQKDGDFGYSSDESTSETEDEDGELMTNDMELKILETIRKIKTKDPSIYNDEVDFFGEEEKKDVAEEGKEEKKKKKKKDEKMTLRDYEKKQIIETDGKLYDSDEEDNKAKASAVPLTHVEQQRQLKKAFLETAEAELNDDEDNFFSKRDKTKEEKEAEEKDFVEWMKDKGAAKEEDEILERYFADENKLDEKERFLRDFILHQGWVDKEQKKKGQIPSYEEIVGEDDAESDLEEVDKADEFEAKYNFRFEEKGSEMLVGHSRNIEGSVRKKDDKRKRMRERKAERKAAERAKKDEELKRLKNLKAKDILDKLKSIQEMAGDLKGEALDGLDLEGEFNEEEYDKRMAEMFNEDYYKQEDGDIQVADDGLAADDKKVSAWEGEEKLEDQDEYEYGEEDFPEDYDEGDGEDYGEEYQEWDDNADAMEEEPTPAAKGKAKAKGKALKFKDLDRKKLAAQGLEKYLDEYYKLDYEDLIAGEIPCRFKYKSVPKNDYNLDIEDILTIPDKQLNKYVGLKKLAPYRDDYETLNPKGRTKLQKKYWSWRKEVEAENPKLKERRIAREKRKEKMEAMRNNLRGDAGQGSGEKSKKEKRDKKDKKDKKKDKKEREGEAENGGKKRKPEEEPAPAEEAEGKRKKKKKNDYREEGEKMTQYGVKQSRLETYKNATGAGKKNKK